MSIVQVIDQPTIERIVASVMPKNATEADRLALGTMMQSYGLNPLRKEVYPISYGGRLSIVVGVDGWRRLAHETGRYASGEATYGHDAEGRVESCTYTVLTKDGGRFSFTCWLDEFRQGTPTWHKSPRHMLRIKAEVHCLKAAFGLAGPTEYDAEVEAAAPAAANPQDDRIAKLNRGLLTAPSTEAVVAPQAEPAAVESPSPAGLEQLAEEVAELARRTGGRRSGKQALAAARRQSMDDAGTRAVLEEWHEALSNTINKENMR
jgi:hypothetical protein